MTRKRRPIKKDSVLESKQQSANSKQQTVAAGNKGELGKRGKGKGEEEAVSSGLEA